MSYDNDNEPVEKPTREVARVEPRKPPAVSTVNNLDELPLAECAKVMMSSGLAKSSDDVGKIVARLSFGRTLGLSAVASLNGIHIGPNSSIILSAALMRLLINRSGRYRLFVKKRDQTGSTIEVFEKLDGEWVPMGVPISFGPEDAKRAGLDKKETYVKWACDMYYARCLAAAFRVYTPDCSCGVAVYLPEELDSPNLQSQPDGSIQEAEVTNVSRKPAAKSKPAPAQVEDAPIDRVKRLLDETKPDLPKLFAHYRVGSLDDLTPDQIADLALKLQQKKAAK